MDRCTITTLGGAALTAGIAIAFTILATALPAMAQVNDPAVIEIVPLPEAGADLEVLRVGPDDDWTSAPPMFSAADAEHDLSFDGWIVATEEDLRIRLDVTDPRHINQRFDGNIWDGDFLRITLDGWG